MSEEATTTATEAEPDTSKDLDPYADNPDVILRDHSYDGIQEYDQKLPNWWLWSLYIFVILFVVQWTAYYQFGIGKTDHDRIDEAIAKIDAIKAAELEKLMGNLDDGVLWQMSQNTAIIDEGKAAYETVCLACHAPDLGGQTAGPQYVGLPLNDEEWKYGGKPLEVFKIVMDGSPDATKGMVAWKDSLGGDKVAKIVAYVLSHHKAP